MRKLTTYDEIENLCEAMIRDFMKRKHYTNSQCVDIEAFVTEYLGIPIIYEIFAEPDPGRIGFFSDGYRPLWVMRERQKAQVVFPDQTAVIDSCLQRPSEIGRKRFTIAHEGAHFILSRHIPLQSKAAFHSDFDGEMTYSQDMLHEMMSMTEALTNRAAACCLMPRFLVQCNLNRHSDGKPLIAYDGYVLAQKEKLVIQKTADALGVNYTPMLTRLKELQLFDLRPIDEYLESEFYHGGGSRP